ncbi:MAG: outer membrane beta-barrel protein [Amoebophilaceae bacterium]|nr:outer membrane beta-barrel protein [Amoebophilaceae bacterium]
MQEPIVSSRQATLRLVVSGAYYFQLQEHCSISSGLSYAFGHVGVVRKAEESIPAIDEQHTVHYLWFPCLFRLYTSEVKIDTSVYVKIGPMPSICLFTRPITSLKSTDTPFIDTKRLGLFLLFGTGISYNFSFNNSFTLGLSYALDILGVVRKKDVGGGKVYIHNNFICLDMGFVFF